MRKPMSLITGAVLCGLALSIFSPAAHAAATVAQAQAGTDPGVLIWVDTEKGTGLDSKSVPAIHDQFAGTVWTLQDDNQLVVTKDGKPVVSALWIANKEGTYVPLHGRIGTLTVDGTIYRDDKDMSQGFGELFINQVAKDGKTARTLRIAIDLKFGGGNAQPTPPDDGGFGNFN